MNKRVEELAHQAGLDSFYVPEWSPWAEEFEKFALLIVKECIDIVPWQYESKIREHFGIENEY